MIPPLLLREGGWNQSNVDDTGGIPDWNAQVKDALTTVDRARSGHQVADPQQGAVEQVWIIPTFFGLSQDIGGTKVGGVYRWSPYGRWPYAQLYPKTS